MRSALPDLCCLTSHCHCHAKQPDQTPEEPTMRFTAFNFYHHLFWLSSRVQKPVFYANLWIFNVSLIGNVQLWLTSWQFCTLDGVLIFTHKGKILLTRKIMKKIVKFCLHLSYKVQNSFHFDEIFHIKFKLPILVCMSLRRHLVAILGSFGTKITRSLLLTWLIINATSKRLKDTVATR